MNDTAHQKPITGWLDIRVRTVDLLVDVMVEVICATEEAGRRVRRLWGKR